MIRSFKIRKERAKRALYVAGDSGTGLAPPSVEAEAIELQVPERGHLRGDVDGGGWSCQPPHDRHLSCASSVYSRNLDGTSVNDHQEEVARNMV
jgi:hypothetical protein